MDFTEKTGTDTMVVSKLSLAPNIDPADVNEVFNDQYWIVNRYGSGSFNTDLTFTPGETIDSQMEQNPDYLKLFKRSGNAIDNWIFTKAASSADATLNTATFSDIAGFSQFIICGKSLPEITSLLPADNETNCDWGQYLRIQFQNDMQAGAGNIIVKKSANGSTVATIPAVNCSYDGNEVEITIGTNLEPLTSYYVLIEDNALKDIYDGNFDGIDDNTTWNFTTGEPDAIPGYAIELDGIDDYENIGHHSSLDISGDLTIECWIKPETHSDWARIIASPSTFNGKYIIALGSEEGKLAFATQIGGNTQYARENCSTGEYNRHGRKIIFTRLLHRDRSASLGIGDPRKCRYSQQTKTPRPQTR